MFKALYKVLTFVVGIGTLLLVCGWFYNQYVTGR
jgi:hypothetical protein